MTLTPNRLTLNAVKAQVGQKALALGHKEIRWASPWHGEGASTQEGVCICCGKQVFVGTHMFPQSRGELLQEACQDQEV